MVAKAKAEMLWEAVVAYAAAAEERGGEGNSGEFHNDRNYRLIAAEFNKAEAELALAFARATGWLPMATRTKDDSRTWALEATV